jgi:hypothetical protein
MAAVDKTADSDRFARCVAVSKGVQRDIDHNVIKGRRFNRDEKFLPGGSSKVEILGFLSADERRYLSQIEGGLMRISSGCLSVTSQPKYWN